MWIAVKKKNKKQVSFIADVSSTMYEFQKVSAVRSIRTAQFHR